MQELEIISDIARNFFLIIGIIVGGFWSYFLFVRQRTLGQRIETTLSSYEVSRDDKRISVIASVSIKNIGRTRLSPSQIAARLYKVDSTSGSRALACERPNILPFFGSSSQGQYCIDPDETSDRVAVFSTSDDQYDFLLLTIETQYEDSVTQRDFILKT